MVQSLLTLVLRNIDYWHFKLPRNKKRCRACPCANLLRQWCLKPFTNSHDTVSGIMYFNLISISSSHCLRKLAIQSTVKNIYHPNNASKFFSEQCKCKKTIIIICKIVSGLFFGDLRMPQERIREVSPMRNILAIHEMIALIIH